MVGFNQGPPLHVLGEAAIRLAAWSASSARAVSRFSMSCSRISNLSSLSCFLGLTHFGGFILCQCSLRSTERVYPT